MTYIDRFYESYDEDNRLLSRHGQVEYRTTMKYIAACLAETKAARILEVGAGTGRYSVALAREGYAVTAVELVAHNLAILQAKQDGTLPLDIRQGNALDLSFLADDTFDVTLLLGPMYHLYTREDKLRALAEAVRVTKPHGYILVAYCMNEPTIIQYVFAANNLQSILDGDLVTPDWHCKSTPREVFELARTEDIADLDAELPVQRIKLVATDGATNYIKQQVDAMDDATFAKWLQFHFAICERQDLVGGSNHTLDILRKL